MKGVAEEKLLPIVSRLISIFQENGKKKETYARFVKRITPEKLHELVNSSM